MKFLSKKLLLLAIVSLFFAFSFENKQDWQLKKETDLVKIEFKQENCSDPAKGTNKEYLFLKLTNKSDQKIRVEFDKESFYNGRCNSCGSDEAKVNVVLEANQIIESNCGSDKKLKIFVSMPTHAEVSKLTSFEISNLQTTQLN